MILFKRESFPLIKFSFPSPHFLFRLKKRTFEKISSSMDFKKQKEGKFLKNSHSIFCPTKISQISSKEN